MSHNEETEAKAYINWLNIKLKGLGIKVSSLETDFKTGVNTNHLAQVLLKKEYRFLFVQANGRQLQKITNLIENENITALIDSTYTFDDINKALHQVSTGHSQGKVIITF